MSSVTSDRTKAKSIPTRKPPWLKVRAPWGQTYAQVRQLLHGLELHTVCEEARCPNIGECWGAGTATLMILGDVCTRACRFCAVTTGNPRGVVDPDEPARVAEAVARMNLRYVVITSVDRDDLPDGGAGIFAETIRLIHQASPDIIVEVLTPDFRGDLDHVRTVVEAHPEVFGQNIETVRRLTHVVRDKRAGYQQTLEVLKAVKEMDPTPSTALRRGSLARRPGRAGQGSGHRIYTKSSIMVGLGERPEEVVETMRDLRAHGVDLLAIGQYLRPTDKRRHYPIAEYVHPDQFAAYQEEAMRLGFLYCASGPLVRSSYRAWEAAMLFGSRD